MTDNEIIKALECHTGNNSKRCQVCPYEIYGYYCLEHLYPDLLDLINRQKAKIKEFDEKIVIQLGMIDYQKAEIERLQNALMGECMLSACSREKEIKSEAIQEFAERFMREAGSRLNGFKYEYIIRDDIFDNLVEEMKEVSE